MKKMIPPKPNNNVYVYSYVLYILSVLPKPKYKKPCQVTDTTPQHTVSSSLLTSCFLSVSQQLMRERQQMASRPFASVAVALGMGAEHTEVVQPLIDVSKIHLTHDR